MPVKLQDFSLHLICDRCGSALLVYRGPLNTMPYGIQLAERIAENADTHRCPKPKKEPHA